MQLGILAAMWRYPVKSLAAEELERADLDVRGIPGDRSAALFVTEGHQRRGKTYEGIHDERLHLQRDPQNAIGLAEERGVSLAVRSEQGQRYFYAAPLSLVFDSWIGEVEQHVGRTLDPRRWRPNLLGRAAAGSAFDENDLLGKTIDVGDARLRVLKPIKRCVVTTYDVEDGRSDPRVLRYVAEERGNVMGVYCEVELAGAVRVGDDLRLRTR